MYNDTSRWFFRTILVLKTSFLRVCTSLSKADAANWHIYQIYILTSVQLYLHLDPFDSVSYFISLMIEAGLSLPKSRKKVEKWTISTLSSRNFDLPFVIDFFGLVSGIFRFDLCVHKIWAFNSVIIKLKPILCDLVLRRAFLYLNWNCGIRIYWKFFYWFISVFENGVFDRNSSLFMFDCKFRGRYHLSQSKVS